MSTRLADWMIYIEYAGTNNRFRLTQSVTMVYDEKKAIDQWNNIITNKLKEERLEKNRDVTREIESTFKKNTKKRKILALIKNLCWYSFDYTQCGSKLGYSVLFNLK
ncbi:hypothetical protein BLOT_009092 [Blomia tropicalis]|nr:hypothetical protein BLOT_009092 [Blomia tropicalis]